MEGWGNGSDKERGQNRSRDCNRVGVSAVEPSGSPGDRVGDMDVSYNAGDGVGTMKWTGKGKYPPEQERERKRALLEAKAARRHRLYLEAVKDKLDLWGEDSLNLEELALVAKHHDFFYPEEG